MQKSLDRLEKENYAKVYNSEISFSKVRMGKGEMMGKEMSFSTTIGNVAFL